MRESERPGSKGGKWLGTNSPYQGQFECLAATASGISPRSGPDDSLLGFSVVFGLAVLLAGVVSAQVRPRPGGSSNKIYF